MVTIEGKTLTLNGKTINYDDRHDFLIQTGRYDGKYKTIYNFKSPRQAILYFNSINIGRGYKKRLVMRENPISMLNNKNLNYNYMVLCRHKS
jgi:hypothetical protein